MSKQTPVPSNAPRPRAREVGIKVGILPTGELNAITDVSGVLVGQTTLIRGDNIRSRSTLLWPKLTMVISMIFAADMSHVKTY